MMGFYASTCCENEDLDNIQSIDSLCTEDRREECEHCGYCRDWVYGSEQQDYYQKCHRVWVIVEKDVNIKLSTADRDFIEQRDERQKNAGRSGKVMCGEERDDGEGK